MFTSQKRKVFIALFLSMFIGFNVSDVHAQAVQAQDIYYMAKNGNIKGLWYHKQHLNTVDSNGNTAYCIALKKNEKMAAKFLERLGTDTKHECVSKLLSENKTQVLSENKVSPLYENNTVEISEGNNELNFGNKTFLGMGKTGWAITGGILAAGSIAAAAGGGGGGGGSGSSDDVPNVPPALKCVNGSIINDNCICDEGWTGNSCETEVICPYNTIYCSEGYEETGNICKSGNIIYKECTPKQVPDGYQQETCGEGYDTADTFLSGTTNYYKCEAKDCSAYQTSCGEGYDSTQSCLSGP